MTPSAALRDTAAADPVVRPIVVEHAYRGLRAQLVMRGALLLFVVATLVAVPPRHRVIACGLVAAGYAASVVLATWWVRRGGTWPPRIGWLAAFVDIGVLSALILLAGIRVDDSWTAFVLTNGFFVIPVLAATELRPRICAAVIVPTVIAYLLTNVAAKQGNGEPWPSLLLRTAMVLAVGLGCLLLSAVQRSRVTTISQLAQTRTTLLGELLTVADRERRTVAEDLHDGALQLVLAARLDLDDARETADPDALARIDRALLDSSRLLRSTVSQLHPSVLEQAGLLQALRELADTARARGGFQIIERTDTWPRELRTDVDALLFAVAREFLTNVVKHSNASVVHIELDRDSHRARLTVIDNGRGLTENTLNQRLALGHIGIASHRIRIDAAGGQLTVTSPDSGGTRARVELPYTPLSGADS